MTLIRESTFSKRVLKLMSTLLKNIFIVLAGRPFRIPSLPPVKSVLYKYRKETNMALIKESTFSKRVLEIDVNFIQKYIHCSLQGGPFGGPACPPVIIYFDFLRTATYTLHKVGFY